MKGSRSAAAEAPAPRGWRPFPLAPLGCALLALAGAALGAGVARTELSLMVWGGAFLALIAFIALMSSGSAILLAGRARKEARAGGRPAATIRIAPAPDGVARFLEKSGVEGEACELVAELGFRLPCLPGCFPRLSARFESATGRKLRFSAPVHSREGELRIPLPRALRGRYSLVSATLGYSDALGLTTCGIAIEPAEDWLCLPAPILPGTGPRPSPGGDKRPRAKARKRSDDFFDHKPYAPGDDVRRLNWKLYSHTGELFVRLGEPVPPPESVFLVAVDTGGGALVGLRAEVLDLLCSMAAGLIERLEASGATVELAVPGVPLATGSRDALAVLAGLAWDEKSPFPAIPERRKMRAALVSLPGSPRTEALARALGGGHVVLVRPDPDPEPAPFAPRLVRAALRILRLVIFSGGEARDGTGGNAATPAGGLAPRPTLGRAYADALRAEAGG